MFLAPYLVYAAVFFAYPLLYAGWLAFHQTDGPNASVFVGLGNFKFVFTEMQDDTRIQLSEISLYK